MTVLLSYMCQPSTIVRYTSKKLRRSGDKTPAHYRLRHIMPTLPHALGYARHGKLRGR